MTGQAPNRKRDTTRKEIRLRLVMLAAAGALAAFPASLAPSTAFAQAQTPAVPIVERPVPEGWQEGEFRGLAYATPPGWKDVERSRSSFIAFGGDAAARVGPGFGMMLVKDPDSIVSRDNSVESGPVMFAGGHVFRRFIARETPADGILIEADVLISPLPVIRGRHILISRMAYNQGLAAHDATFERILATVRLPAIGVEPAEPILEGAFRAPVPAGWDTGSYSDDEVLIFENPALQGELKLLRHEANEEPGFLDPWFIPDGTPGRPVTMLGHPALLYRWSHDPKSLNDGSDADAVTRVYVFEACLPGPDTLSIAMTGLPSFYASAELAGLLDRIEVAAGTALCAAANLPKGALVGTTGARPDGRDVSDAGGVESPPETDELAQGTALDGLLAYKASKGWHALLEADSLTIVHPDGRGYLTVAKGDAVLPPDGLVAQVPPGRLGSFADNHYRHWTEFGWPGEKPEFLDDGRLVAGWRFLQVARECLPGQEPVAVAWGGIDRFLSGEALKEIRRGLDFRWPVGMQACALENASAGARPADPPPTDGGVAEEPLVAPDASSSAIDSFTSEEGGYVRYRNARYGTVISYPADLFSPLPPPGNGDGRTFETADAAARFYVFAQFNALGQSQKEMLEEDKAADWRDKVTYERSGAGWYVISGYSGDDIFYRKVVIEPSDLVRVFEVTYPSAMRAQMDAAVTRMSRSFGAAASP